MTGDPRRALPSVGTLLESESLRALRESVPRALIADAIREVVDAARREPAAAPESEEGWARSVAEAAARRRLPSLRPVINATGVVLHTNLGRAPLAAAARDAMLRVADGYTNLEYDLERGARGSRHVHAVALLRELTGAEDAIVVNNCAAALVLALDALANGRDVLVSRGELVEIGGSFRIPEIMRKSGARLQEIGTTNRTHVDDYRRALGPTTAAILKVHRGNFAMEGFVAEATVRELVPVAREGKVPLLHDLGSGLLLSLADFGLDGEPTARDALEAGASLVMMSGDKLLGGPQCGIVLGAAPLIAALRADPLARALRVDKLTLAALEATLDLHRDPARALREVPTLRMLTTPATEIRARAEAVARALAARGIGSAVRDSVATVGGGAFPTARIPSAAIALDGPADALATRLRGAATPVVGRIADDALQLDLRSVMAEQDALLLRSIAEAIA